MKKATILLTREHLRILRKGGPVTVRLPDAILEISIHPDARLAFSLDGVLDETQAVLDKAKGKTCREPLR